MSPPRMHLIAWRVSEKNLPYSGSLVAGCKYTKTPVPAAGWRLQPCGQIVWEIKPVRSRHYWQVRGRISMTLTSKQPGRDHFINDGPCCFLLEVLLIKNALHAACWHLSALWTLQWVIHRTGLRNVNFIWNDNHYVTPMTYILVGNPP